MYILINWLLFETSLMAVYAGLSLPFFFALYILYKVAKNSDSKFEFYFVFFNCFGIVISLIFISRF